MNDDFAEMVQRMRNRPEFQACVAASLEKAKSDLKVQSARYIAKNKDKIKQRRKENPAKHLLAGAKARAKKLEILFDLKLEDIVVPKFCPALGILLEVSENFHSDSSPSLDRLDPDRGYVKGNVRVISWKANRIKSNASADDLEMIAAYIRENSLHAVDYPYAEQYLEN